MRLTLSTAALAAAALMLVFASGCSRKELPLEASQPAVALDRQINWDHAKLIAVQDQQRYKTLDSFARESIHVMYGKEHFPGLSPLASLCEWLFRRDAYANTPLIKIKEAGLRVHFTSHMPDEQRERIRRDGMMTPRELTDPVVRARIDELEGRFDTKTAINRVRGAQAITQVLPRLTRIVPGPGTNAVDEWFTPDDLKSNAAFALPESERPSLNSIVQQFGTPIPGIRPEPAARVVGLWKRLGDAWRSGDAATVQSTLDQLATVLPAMAQPGVYPSESQRAAEARYYAMGKFTYGHWFYLVGALISVWALVTRWRFPWILGLLFLSAGLAVHGYGVALRWYIVGRIPVANMFEAIVWAAWVAILLALIMELCYPKRVVALAANITGFFSLIVAGYILPNGGTITAIMGILDDVMLRIHTVMIVASYSMIFLASIIAIVYLFGYYLYKHASRSIESGFMAAFGGGLLVLATTPLFSEFSLFAPAGASGYPTIPWVIGLTSTIIGGAALAALLLLPVIPVAIRSAVTSVLIVIATVFVTLGLAPYGFVNGLGWALLAGGLAWAIATFAGATALGMRSLPAQPMAFAFAPGGVSMHAAELELKRPIMAGGAPGDERASELPDWLNHFDWCHLILLNIVFVLLFGGVILGAVWADYSWGRPWGWDPKEVFAMNTWIIYAILIHVRFVVKKRGLWTAWLSVIGCLMMVFNWCVVNFFIVGLHSYA